MRMCGQQPSAAANNWGFDQLRSPTVQPQCGRLSLPPPHSVQPSPIRWMLGTVREQKAANELAHFCWATVVNTNKGTGVCVVRWHSSRDDIPMLSHQFLR